jgi:hypothetical protein
MLKLPYKNLCGVIARLVIVNLELLIKFRIALRTNIYKFES